MRVLGGLLVVADVHVAFRGAVIVRGRAEICPSLTAKKPDSYRMLSVEKRRSIIISLTLPVQLPVHFRLIIQDNTLPGSWLRSLLSS